VGRSPPPGIPDRGWEMTAAQETFGKQNAAWDGSAAIKRRGENDGPNDCETIQNTLGRKEIVAPAGTMGMQRMPQLILTRGRLHHTVATETAAPTRPSIRGDSRESWGPHASLGSGQPPNHSRIARRGRARMPCDRWKGWTAIACGRGVRG